eukprot:TRINITY_DN75242_c0_g1_i1.p2 TRINITY_DN75242_c0_g1~~TRINITY_DN75242_c0_g1_i1.p2  ORF type:complete len:100 (+),score=5.51 TRINITY_DN75242_c0_g1_i1:1-300(+)
MNQEQKKLLILLLVSLLWLIAKQRQLLLIQQTQIILSTICVQQNQKKRKRNIHDEEYGIGGRNRAKTERKVLQGSFLENINKMYDSGSVEKLILEKSCE